MLAYKKVRVQSPGNLDFLLETLFRLNKQKASYARERGHVFVDDRISLSNRRLGPGAEIKLITEFGRPNQKFASIEAVENSYLVINKKQGGPTELADSQDTRSLQSWLLSYLLRQNPKQFPYCQAAHRLDSETTGLIIFATKKSVRKELNDYFEKRQIYKTYLCVTRPFSRDDFKANEKLLKTDSKVIVHEEGKEALTQARCLKKGNNFWLWSVRPKTGRSHQIRVHFAHRGIPLLGDSLYGGEKAERLFLHSHKIEIPQIKKTYQAAPPKDFLQALEEKRS